MPPIDEVSFLSGRAAPLLRRFWALGLLALALTFMGLAAQLPRSAAAGGEARPAAAAACENVLGDGDFELAWPAISPWSQAATPNKVRLGPDTGNTASTLPIRICEGQQAGEICEVQPGINDPAGPAAGGITWAWFGGGYTSTLPITNVVQLISQGLTIPVTSTARLEFDLWISRADPGSDAADRLEARFGNTSVFSVTAAHPAPYASGYTPVVVDLASFGSGFSTTLTISGTTRAGQNTLPPVVNFNVDNLRVCLEALPASAFTATAAAATAAAAAQTATALASAPTPTPTATLSPTPIPTGIPYPPGTMFLMFMSKGP